MILEITVTTGETLWINTNQIVSINMDQTVHMSDNSKYKIRKIYYNGKVSQIVNVRQILNFLDRARSYPLD